MLTITLDVTWHYKTVNKFDSACCHRCCNLPATAIYTDVHLSGLPSMWGRLEWSGKEFEHLEQRDHPGNGWSSKKDALEDSR